MPNDSATTVASTTTTTPANGEWHAGLDADTKGWVGGMGLDKLPADQALLKVLPMYRGAEQKLGVPADQVIRLPGKDAKPEDWRPIWQRLGAPEKPDGYEIPVPDGHDPAFAKTAAGWFHELGIPAGAAKELAGKWNEHVAGLNTQAVADWNSRFDKEVGELKGEWKGDDYAKNMDLSNRVLKTMGFNEEQQKALEQALGPKAFRMAFAKFGSAIGEHRFVGDGKSDFGASPEAAKARIEALKKDSAWMAKYVAGDADAKAEWTRLHEAAFGTEPANPILA